MARAHIINQAIGQTDRSGGGVSLDHTRRAPENVVELGQTKQLQMEFHKVTAIPSELSFESESGACN